MCDFPSTLFDCVYIVDGVVVVGAVGGEEVPEGSVAGRVLVEEVVVAAAALLAELGLWRAHLRL